MEKADLKIKLGDSLFRLLSENYIRYCFCVFRHVILGIKHVYNWRKKNYEGSDLR